MKISGILINIGCTIAILFILAGFPILKYLIIPNISNDVDAVSSASLVLPEQPSGDFLVYINESLHEDSVDSWEAFFMDEEFSVIFRRFQTNDNIVDEDFFFAWSNTKNGPISLSQLTCMTARKIVRQLAFHLIIHNLPTWLQFTLSLLNWYFGPIAADEDFNLLRSSRKGKKDCPQTHYFLHNDTKLGILREIAMKCLPI